MSLVKIMKRKSMKSSKEEMEKMEDKCMMMIISLLMKNLNRIKK